MTIIMEDSLNIKYLEYECDSNPKPYFKIVKKINDCSIWYTFVKYVKNDMDNFEKNVPNLNKINVNFKSLLINDEDYVICKFLCESAQIKNLCLTFKNLIMRKNNNKKYTKLYFTQYMCPDNHIPTQILSNLPTNT